MNYKGYTAIVEIDEDDGVLHGRLAGIRDVITFESETIEGLEREFQTSVDLYLDWCAERGKAPSIPHAERRRAAS
ncbi:MAG TPA: type II toxin-antitoxin system HicB family antitoxin [Longimicrobium sp.]|nr:type II toxin-antitoxin system HicB family antitoxin [Longimicrobium sp.]